MFLQKGLWNMTLRIYMHYSCTSSRENNISVIGRKERNIIIGLRSKNLLMFPLYFCLQWRYKQDAKE